MAVKDILLLGNPLLYKKSEPVKKDEVANLIPFMDELSKTVTEFRRKYGVGRAIAAPQLGLHKRIICINIDSPVVIINPLLTDLSREMIELWERLHEFSQPACKIKKA